mgnify:CR=1 FL=1
MTNPRPNPYPGPLAIARRLRYHRAMAKPANSFTCSACGATHRKWAGKCDACGDCVLVCGTDALWLANLDANNPLVR